MPSTSPHKPELPPLLSPGLHRMTMDELWRLCVGRFPNSSTRERLFEGFCNLKSVLVRAAISAEIWIDGSFLTEKIDADDVDFVMKLDGDIFCSWSSAQQELIFQITAKQNRDWIKQQFCCHCFAFAVFPPGHPDFYAGQYWDAQWRKDFGYALRSRQPKGIAVIELKDGRHLRITSHNTNRLPQRMGRDQVNWLRPFR